MLQILLGDTDITKVADDLTFSNVDPGGYEACSFTLPAGAVYPKPGTPIRLFEGMEVAWWGQVEDPGPHDTDRGAKIQVQGVGDGVYLKDTQYRFIYVDRDLSLWGTPSTQRKILQNSGGYDMNDGHIAPDETNGAPSAVLEVIGAWARSAKSELWYSALGMDIDRIYYDVIPNSSINTADVNWFWEALISAADDTLAVADETANLRAASASGYLASTVAGETFAAISMRYDPAAGTEGQRYNTIWRKLAVYGKSGLTRQGSDPGGFYPQDIADHARQQAGLQYPVLSAGVIEAQTSFIVPHASYREYVPPEQVVDEMARLLGWHWGVWGPLRIHDQSAGIGRAAARLDFRSRPSSATIHVDRSELDGLTISERRSAQYDTVIVTYTDGAGTPHAVTVSVANPRMPAFTTNDSRIISRTLGPLDLGLSSAAAASAFGTTALQLAQVAQRSGGSPQVPASVQIANAGGGMPSTLIKAGLDRLHIGGITDSGQYHLPNSQRFDTFRIRRVETTSTQGRVRTTVELDEGADLLEVLQARLALSERVNVG